MTFILDSWVLEDMLLDRARKTTGGRLSRTLLENMLKTIVMELFVRTEMNPIIDSLLNSGKFTMSENGMLELVSNPILPETRF